MNVSPFFSWKTVIFNVLTPLTESKEELDYVFNEVGMLLFLIDSFYEEQSSWLNSRLADGLGDSVLFEKVLPYGWHSRQPCWLNKAKWELTPFLFHCIQPLVKNFMYGDICTHRKLILFMSLVFFISIWVFGWKLMYRKFNLQLTIEVGFQKIRYGQGVMFEGLWHSR